MATSIQLGAGLHGLTKGLTKELSTGQTGDVKLAAKKLEAYFLRHLLGQMRKSGFGGLLSSGFGNEMFREMMDEVLADAMGNAGGLGIAKLMTPQLASRKYAESSGSLTVLPVPGAISSGFGMRITPRTKQHRFHHGVDLWARLGTPVRAAAAVKSFAPSAQAAMAIWWSLITAAAWRLGMPTSAPST